MTWSAGEAKDKRVLFEDTAVPFLGILYNYALRLTRNPDDARDVVQETMLRAFRTFENFVPGTNCKAWLFKILYSVFVNRYHESRREPETVLLDEQLHRLPAPRELSGLRERLGEGWSARVEEALARLPDGFRSAVLLVDVEELTYEEASEVLGCPLGTVRSRLSRGRRMLYGALVEHARSQGLLKVSSS